MQAHPHLSARLPLRPDPDHVGRLWTQYAATRDPEARSGLLTAYAEFARMMAAKVYARRTYSEMEFGDYLQYATVGLIEALDRFEPGRGIKFETYASSRITGAMLNGIEQSSEIQQQVAARRRIIGQRVASLMEQDSGAAAASVEDAFARLAEIAIGLAVGFALDETGMHASEGAHYQDNCYTGLELRQLQKRVNAVVDQLPGNQRRVIHGHYLQHLQFEEIAAGMALTRGRVAQIHKQALASLRLLLQDRGQVDLRC
jgi:RNA polymerase sigma factor for flagellar operon FliA